MWRVVGCVPYGSVWRDCWRLPDALVPPRGPPGILHALPSACRATSRGLTSSFTGIESSPSATSGPCLRPRSYRRCRNRFAGSPSVRSMRADRRAQRLREGRTTGARTSARAIPRAAGRARWNSEVSRGIRMLVGWLVAAAGCGAPAPAPPPAPASASASAPASASASASGTRLQGRSRPGSPSMPAGSGGARPRRAAVLCRMVRPRRRDGTGSATKVRVSLGGRQNLSPGRQHWPAPRDE